MPDSPASNRRRSERKPVARTFVLYVDSDRDQIANSAFAVDLSALGVRIRSTIKLLPGQLVTIVPREGSEQAIRSRVIWVGEAGSNRVGEAGIAFLQPLGDLPD
jgi:D-lyxose ketol-isomerase